MKIGIIKEGKQPFDQRAPITPLQAQQLNNSKDVEVICQASPHRCFSDKEYESANIKVVDEISNCDVLLGVKEVPINELIENKTYFFFSHTIKKQPYNKDLLKSIIQKKIKLVDYECLKNDQGIRIIAFGRWAGIVGTYNALWTYGRKFNLFELKSAPACKDLNELK